MRILAHTGSVGSLHILGFTVIGAFLFCNCLFIYVLCVNGLCASAF